MVVIPEGLFTDYEMNPETDEVLFDGRSLKNGMVVLLEDEGLRAHCSDPRIFNRWALVSEVQVVLGDDGKIIGFIATYSDGTKRKRLDDIRLAWLVKKDSIPKEDPIQVNMGEIHRANEIADRMVEINRGSGILSANGCLPADFIATYLIEFLAAELNNRRN